MLASIASVGAVAIVFRGLTSFSRTAFIMDGVLLLLGVVGTRISFRVIRDFLSDRASAGRAKKRVVIYGAGDGGEMLLREIRNNESLGLFAVAFIDDDPAKTGKIIHGVEVAGTFKTLDGLLRETAAEELVVSIGHVDERRIAEVDLLCQQHGVAFRRASFGLVAMTSQSSS